MAQKDKPAPSAVAAKKQKGSGLRNIIFLSMFAASTIPVGVSSYLNYEQTRQDVYKNADASLRLQARSNADLVESWLVANTNSVRAMALAQDAVSMDAEKGSVYVKALQKQAPQFYAFFVTDPTGQQIAKSDDKLNKVGDREYFKRAMVGDTSFQLSTSRTTGRFSFLAGAPIKDAENKVVGVFGGAAEMDSVNDKVTGRKIGATGFSYLVNNDNVIMAHPKKDLIGKAADEAVKRLDTEFATDDGASAGKAFRRTAVPFSQGLKLVSQIDRDEIEAPLEDAKDKAIKLVGLAALLSLFFSFVLGSAIARSINRLSDLADKLSVAQSGPEIDKLSAEIDKVGGSREVRSLGGAISRLANSIKLALEALN